MRNPPGVTVTALPPHLARDGLWVGLQVEEPGAIKHLGTVEVQASDGISERTFEPQAFEIDDLLGVGKSRWVSGHHVADYRSRARRLDVVGDQDVQAGYLAYLTIEHGIRLGGRHERRVLEQEPLHPRRNDDEAPSGWKVDLVHQDGEVDELLIHVRRGELRGLDGVIRRRRRSARVEGSYVGVRVLGELVGRPVGCSVYELGAHLCGVYIVNFEAKIA